MITRPLQRKQSRENAARSQSAFKHQYIGKCWLASSVEADRQLPARANKACKPGEASNGVTERRTRNQRRYGFA